MAHLVQMSNEVIDDSDPSAVEVVRDNLLAAMALKADQQLLEGPGTAPEVRGLKNRRRHPDAHGCDERPAADEARPLLEHRRRRGARDGGRAAGVQARAGRAGRMALTRPCLDCGTLTRSGSRCDPCHAKRRGTTSQRGYGAAHQRRRERVIAAQPWWSVCGHTGSPENPLTGDHVVPVSKGGGRWASPRALPALQLSAGSRKCPERCSLLTCLPD